MTDLLAEAKKQERLLESTLYKRMDEDNDLINVADRILYDTAKPKKEIPNSVFVPLNDIIVFATTVESYLNDAEEQIAVTSEDKNLDTAQIESLIKAIWKSVDSRWRKGIGTGGKQFTFNPFTDQQTTRRGRTSHLCIFRIEDGELITDIRGWDTRFVTYGMDEKGLAWASYLTRRPPDLIAQEYPDVKLPKDKDLIAVRNILTRKENIVYVDDQIALNQAHKYGETPVVNETVPIGSMLMDENSLKYQGESIFLMIRDIFPELMRFASIIQSLNMKELDHALQEKVDPSEMDGSTPPEHDQVTNPRSVTKTTGGFSPVPIGELRQQAERLHEMLEVRMQRGGINNFDMGTFNQAMSAVALIRVGQGRDKVFGPRLGTRGLCKQDLTEMAIRQILQEAKDLRSVKIGRQIFDLDILKGEFDIEYKYSIKDATVDAARQSIASAQRGMLPRISILRDTLQREDPDGDLRELYSEEAEIAIPNVKTYRILKSLAEKAEKGDEDAEIELNLGLAQLGISLDQLFAGQLPNQPPMEQPKPSQPINIFDAGNGGNQGVQNA